MAAPIPDKWIRAACLTTALCTAAASAQAPNAAHYEASPAYPPSVQMVPAHVPMQAPGWATGQTLQHAPHNSHIQQVQHSDEVPERPLDARIETLREGGDEKVDVIHHRSQLMVTRQPIRRVFISDPSVMEVVQYSPTEISLLGLSLGTTDLQIWFEGSDDPVMYLATVIKDPALEDQRRLDYGKIERKLALLYPNSKVYLIPMSRKIIVRGQAKDAEEAARIMQVVRGEIITQDGSIVGGDLYGFNAGTVGPNDVLGARGNNLADNLLSSMIVNEMQVPGEFQINVRIRIAELSRSELRRMGIDWQVLLNDARHIVTQTAFAGTPLLTGVFENGEITVLLDALASNGTAKIMEDASVTTLSGEPAAFLAGGEFAVPSTVAINGVGVGTTTFRGFGTSVITTPTVIDRDLIRLQIIPELSEISGANTVGGIPGLNVRRVQTRVELREGQTIVLGGLFSRQQRAEVSRIPFLGDLPIVGNYLFNGKRATEDEKEMLIVVTPEIVRPMDPEEVPPLPGWHVTHPDDFDFYKFNRTEGNPNMGHYQLLPYGNGQGYAEDRGYNFHNPAPGLAQPPLAGAAYGGGYAAPAGGAPYGGAPYGGGPYGGYPTGAPGYAPQLQPTPAPVPAAASHATPRPVHRDPGIQQAGGFAPQRQPAPVRRAFVR